LLELTPLNRTLLNLMPPPSSSPSSSSRQSAQPRHLYLVATPIGNLEDITLRALRLLKEVDLIACEDTRQTQKLLHHHGISKPLVSYHEHNEAERAADLVRQMEQGKSVALVSDAGMPGVCDPGYRVATLAIAHGIPVVPVAGGSAVTAALAASGLPSDAFSFHGFLPARQGQRRRRLEEIASRPDTQIFYEAPHRLLEALRDVAEVLGARRPLVIARELTKVHEEFLRGTAEELLQQLTERPGGVKGEVTLLIGKVADAGPSAGMGTTDLRGRLEQIMRERGLDEKSALKALAKDLGVSKSEAYRRIKINS
jgi:16S rRNA (cytidine1402-2'-O)-methyltransferase